MIAGSITGAILAFAATGIDMLFEKETLIN